MRTFFLPLLLCCTLAVSCSEAPTSEATEEAAAPSLSEEPQDIGQEEAAAEVDYEWPSHLLDLRNLPNEWYALESVDNQLALVRDCEEYIRNISFHQSGPDVILSLSEDRTLRQFRVIEFDLRNADDFKDGQDATYDFLLEEQLGDGSTIRGSVNSVMTERPYTVWTGMQSFYADSLIMVASENTGHFPSVSESCFECWGEEGCGPLDQNAFVAKHGLSVLVWKPDSSYEVEFRVTSSPDVDRYAFDLSADGLPDGFMSPYNYAPEYEILHLPMIGFENGFRKVIANGEEFDELWISAEDTRWKFYTWPEYLIQATAIDQLSLNRTALVKYPGENAPMIEIPAAECMVPVSVIGDWLEVRFTSCGTDASTSTSTGWMRWRNEEELLVTPIWVM